MTHYHITKNTPGYSPWTSFMVENKTTAIAALVEEKRMYQQHDLEGDFSFAGNAREDLFYFVTDRSRTHDLGFIIQATPCDEDCDPEGEY